MKINKVPFYANTLDDTHCFQAALRMVMKHCWPERDYSWEELEKITAKVEGLWTWPMSGMLWLREQGMEVKHMEVFDYEKFAEEGGQYLIDQYGEEVGKAQIEHSDIKQEKRFAREFVKKIETVRTIPAIDDIKTLLEEEYLLICNVNSRALINEEGYAGHFVVVKGFDDTHLLIHDPGLPPHKNNRVGLDIFEKAWAYPNERAKNIMAFRLHRNSSVK